MNVPPSPVDLLHPTSSPTHQHASPAPTLTCKGRVRTGCLICRARKVKCDEQRPACRKCERLNKTCVYRTPGAWNPPTTDPDLVQGRRNSVPGMIGTLAAEPGRHVPAHEVHKSPLNAASDLESQGIIGLPDVYLTQEHSPGQSASSTMTQSNLYVSESPPDRYQQASQLIYLSIVTDWMAACETPTESSFSYFTDMVDCPLISPFDSLNWTRVKHHIVYVGFQQPLVAQALLAIQVLYRAQVDRLPMAHATSVYQNAVTGFRSALDNDATGFEIVLMIAFLLCLCAVTLPNEDGSHLAILEGALEGKLEAWLISGRKSPISLRLCAWLQILGTSTKRQGSPGILPPSVATLLQKHVNKIPSLSELDRDRHPERCLYDSVADPVFNLYLQLQVMSNRVAGVTHYHRSRTLPEDQVEVTELMDALKTDISDLWDNRPGSLRLQPEELRAHFSAQIAEPLIALSGLCMAAFHAEHIVIGRILGDRPFPNPEAKDALDGIRAIVDGDWNVSNGSCLSPGFVRPVFVYALEIFERDSSHWASDRLRQVTHPSSRGNFLASFVEAHGEAQRAESRRVTMKFFCYQTFGVPLPFM